MGLNNPLWLCPRGVILLICCPRGGAENYSSVGNSPLCRPRSANVRVYCFYVPEIRCLGNQTSLRLPCKNGCSCIAWVGKSKERVSLVVQLQFLSRWLLTGETVIDLPVSLIAVVPTRSREIRVLRIFQCSICFPLATDKLCILKVWHWPRRPLWRYLGLFPVDDDDEKSQLNQSIASLPESPVWRISHIYFIIGGRMSLILITRGSIFKCSLLYLFVDWS